MSMENNYGYTDERYDDTESVRPVRTTRLYLKNRRKRQQKRRAAMVLFGLPTFAFLMGVLLTLFVVEIRSGSARRDYGRTLQYATYDVQSGDTFWGIAVDMAAINPEFTDVRQYLDLLQRTNKYCHGTLKTGDTILIPYYAAPDGEDGLEHDMLGIYAKYDINYSKWVDIIKDMQ